MQAAVMYKPGDIRLEEVPKPTAKKGEALLRIAAVGVCGSDIPRLLTKGAHRVPIICGHEFSGEIVEVGEEVDGFDIGEFVGVAPMLPSRVCDQCMTGNFPRCRNYDYFGSRRDGAYAEFVAAPIGNLLKTPKGTDPRAIAMTDPASIALLHDLPRMSKRSAGASRGFRPREARGRGRAGGVLRHAPPTTGMGGAVAARLVGGARPGDPRPDGRPRRAGD